MQAADRQRPEQQKVGMTLSANDDHRRQYRRQKRICNPYCENYAGACDPNSRLE
jgi:hypothetical protein